jgi:hypothetical protein
MRPTHTPTSRYPTIATNDSPNITRTPVEVRLQSVPYVQEKVPFWAGINSHCWEVLS